MAVTNPASDVSLVLATYNGSQYLAEQLDSIAAQSLRPAELLIYDDGSSPSEREAIRAIVGRFDGAILVEGDNVGITANFSRAIAAVTRPYVALADQDDIWTADHLVSLRDAIGAADLVYGDMRFMDEDGRVSDERFSQRIRTIGSTSEDPWMFNALLHNSVVWGACTMFRRDLVAGRVIPDTRRYHDWWLSVLAMMRGGIRYVDRPLVDHRIHAANSSHHPEKSHGVRSVVDGSVRNRRHAQAQRTLVCLQALREEGFTFDPLQCDALDQAMAYVNSLIVDDRRVWRTAYALRHRRVMTPDRPPIMQAAIALAKLR